VVHRHHHSHNHRNIEDAESNLNTPHINLNEISNKSINSDLIKSNFNELVDIRGAFDIKQFQNKTGYDCYIECEMNYFKIKKDKLTNSNSNSNNSNLLNNDSGPKHKQSCKLQEMALREQAAREQFMNSNFNKININTTNSKADHLNYVNNSNIHWNEYLNKSLINKNNSAFMFTDNDLSNLYFDNMKSAKNSFTNSQLYRKK
jgi:hypothetical protein